MIRIPAAEPAELEPKREGGEAPAVPAGRHRILVADDNVDAALSLAMMLRLMGNEVRIAHDGLAAVAAANEFRPNLILLEIGMPMLNGYDACRRIREEPWGSKVTVVALTGWAQEQDNRRSREAGFDRHLVKPVEPTELQEVLFEVSQTWRNDNPNEAGP